MYIHNIHTYIKAYTHIHTHFMDPTFVQYMAQLLQQTSQMYSKGAILNIPKFLVVLRVQNKSCS